MLLKIGLCTEYEQLNNLFQSEHVWNNVIFNISTNHDTKIH